MEDIDGERPQAIEDKMVHDAVLAFICGHNENLSWKRTCVYYNGLDFSGGLGFCDLYNKKTGEVWELKKDSASYSCKSSVAQAQLGRYISGRLKWHPRLTLQLPTITSVEMGTFSFESGGYVYSVRYWYEGAGILRYSYDKEKKKGREVAEAVALVAATGAGLNNFSAIMAKRYGLVCTR